MVKIHKKINVGSVYYYYYYYYYNCGDLSDDITQNVTGALYTSHCGLKHDGRTELKQVSQFFC